MTRRPLLAGLLLTFLLASCAAKAPTPASGSSSQSGSSGGPAPTEAAEITIQDDVPMMEAPLDLTVTSGGTYISYQAESTVDEATKFYQEQLEISGWERVNRNDTGFGDSITLLRAKPDQKITVTLQSIAGSTKIRVLITLSPR